MGNTATSIRDANVISHFSHAGHYVLDFSIDVGKSGNSQNLVIQMKKATALDMSVQSDFSSPNLSSSLHFRVDSYQNPSLFLKMYSVLNNSNVEIKHINTTKKKRELDLGDVRERGSELGDDGSELIVFGLLQRIENVLSNHIRSNDQRSAPLPS